MTIRMLARVLTVAAVLGPILAVGGTPTPAYARGYVVVRGGWGPGWGGPRYWGGRPYYYPPYYYHHVWPGYWGGGWGPGWYGGWGWSAWSVGAVYPLWPAAPWPGYAYSVSVAPAYDYGTVTTVQTYPSLAAVPANSVSTYAVPATVSYAPPQAPVAAIPAPTPVSAVAATPEQASARTGQECREYTSTVTVGGQSQPVVGTACRQPDGTWRILN